jgi:hypothetical protein
MNRTEAAYSGLLEGMRRSGEIKFYAFESTKFKLAKNTYYSPDFMVVRADGVTEFHEVKGFMTDDANVKIKVAADRFHFVFKLVRFDRQRGWQVEEV